MQKDKPHFGTFHEGILVSLWNFQVTLVITQPLRHKFLNGVYLVWIQSFYFSQINCDTEDK